MKTIFFLFSYLVISILLTGCSSTQLLSSWNDTSAQKSPIEPVLIIGVANNNPTIRNIYEDTFVNSFAKAKILAIPSHTISEQPIEPNEQSLREIIKKADAGTVLITHILDAKEENSFIPSSYVVGSNSYAPGRLYSYYPFVRSSVSDMGSYVNKTIVILESNLYDVKTENLIWSARTKSIDPVMTKKYYQGITDILTSDLTSKHL